MPCFFKKIGGQSLLHGKINLNVRAGALKFWEKVHLPPTVQCHVSHVACHIVTCHVSCVMCHMSHVILFIFLICEACQWRVCYQQGLPRIVSIQKGCVCILSYMQNVSVFFATDRMCLYSFLYIECVCFLSNNLTYVICVIRKKYFIDFLYFLHSSQYPVSGIFSRHLLPVFFYKLDGVGPVDSRPSTN